MSFRYKYLSDVATADAAFVVEADSWDELFAGATEATTVVMVSLADLREDIVRELEVASESVDQLLYDWLSEIVYLKDTDGLLVKSADISVTATNGWRARGTLRGDRVDRDRQRLGQDVKAVTYHLYEVSHDGCLCHAKVVLDI
jgi:SHS2 domain-containing protein